MLVEDFLQILCWSHNYCNDYCHYAWGRKNRTLHHTRFKEGQVRHITLIVTVQPCVKFNDVVTSMLICHRTARYGILWWLPHLIKRAIISAKYRTRESDYRRRQYMQMAFAYLYRLRWAGDCSPARWRCALTCADYGKQQTAAQHDDDVRLPMQTAVSRRLQPSTMTRCMLHCVVS